MMKLIGFVITIALAAVTALGQAPSLHIVETDGPNLPADLFYGSIKVKPLRLRPGTNQVITINDTDFFVHQQYVDFLSRFGDPAGLAFWQNEITSCGANPTCIELKRINVSAAFFLSIEFKDTGYLVYRIYKASFGNLPSKPVPVTRDQLMPDTRTIGDGIQVGVGDWVNQLEAHKVAFTQAFVQRPAFLAAFPSGMTAAAFVDLLDANAGSVLSSSEKANLVGVLGTTPGDTVKRASVLRSVAENQNLSNAEFNKAFVLMQYFSYLHRNPDAAPDTDFSGFNFWLAKLNQFNGNFVNAEMVKAFLVSGEYNQRF